MPISTGTPSSGGGGGAPTGPAGGDLAGTYPNPSVAKVTETSGPTDLTIGAIANGEYVKRSGATLVSGAPVASVAATDASIVVGGTATAPTVATATLDVIATQHPPVAAVAFNGQKGTGVANGTAASDIAAFGQIPTALPPNGAAGGDLTGSYPNPTLNIDGKTGKTTPADGDELPLADSAASFATKKLSWANLKATLKTYFDTLYVSTVFGRTGTVVATAGDYTAAQVTNAADKSSGSSQAFTGGITSAHATQGIGYATGAGGAVTQLTSRTTAVTLNKITGQVTTFNSSMSSAAATSFTVNNTAVAIGDTVLVNCQNDLTTAPVMPPYVAKVQNGSFVLVYANNSLASSTTAFVFNFVVIKAVAA